MQYAAKEKPMTLTHTIGKPSANFRTQLLINGPIIPTLQSENPVPLFTLTMGSSDQKDRLSRAIQANRGNNRHGIAPWNDRHAFCPKWTL